MSAWFAVARSLCLETKLRTTSATVTTSSSTTASGQTPPKQTIPSIYPRTNSQQLTPNKTSPPTDKTVEAKTAEVYAGTLSFDYLLT